ncbi:acetoacetate decarboxylase family protein [Streptomyces sp. SID3343]|uniref:acetoacetate decarboxylase family protein n=1 Tax=Streptomyces sp. SID3343 TaxID=2690260 RepID=UPI00136DC01E|nr:acetoacetate decarboxylase [Streptomyces sp. SID3343]
MSVYPPEPWQLCGQLHLSLFAVPRRLLSVAPPAGTRPVSILGRHLVGAAWVVYEPGGVLAYRELLVAVLVREGPRLRVHICDIRVDHAVARDGGRALWGIPKDLARIDIRQDSAGRVDARAETTHRHLARARFMPRLRVPGRWSLAGRIVQTLDGRPKTSRVRVRTGLRIASARWEFPLDGSLGPLSGRRRPVVSLSLRDFRLRFGG